MTGTDLQQCDIENNLQEKWPLSNCKIDANWTVESGWQVLLINCKT
jgi:hypothetical protein